MKQVTQELEEIKASQMRMEDTIYMLSIQNKQRQDDKELMLMLLPHIHKAINGKANNLKGLLQQFESDGNKNKVLKLLQTYKIPGLK